MPDIKKNSKRTQQVIQLKPTQRDQNSRIPLVSIVTSIYNVEEYIGLTINSIIKQSYPKWELIIVDDCSTDNTYRVVQDLISHLPILHRNKVIVHSAPTNRGKFYNLNWGINKSKGDLITFIDGDDIFHPQKIKIQVDLLMKNKNLVANFTSYLRVKDIDLPLTKIEQGRNIVYSRQFYENSIMFRRKTLKEIGYYDCIRFNGDDEYANRIRTYYNLDKISVVNKYLYYAVQRTGSLTTSKSTGYKSQARSLYRESYKEWHCEYKRLLKKLEQINNSKITKRIDMHTIHTVINTATNHEVASINAGGMVNALHIKGIHQHRIRSIQHSSASLHKKKEKKEKKESKSKEKRKDEDKEKYGFSTPEKIKRKQELLRLDEEAIKRKLKNFLYMPFPVTESNYPIKLPDICKQFITFTEE